MHTVHKDGSRFNEVEGQSPTGGSYDPKEPAVAAGRDLARERQVEHIIGGLDRQVHERSGGSSSCARTWTEARARRSSRSSRT